MSFGNYARSHVYLNGSSVKFNSDFTQFREIQDDYYTDGCGKFYTIFNDNPKWEFIRPNSFQLDVSKAVRNKIKN